MMMTFFSKVQPVVWCFQGNSNMSGIPQHYRLFVCFKGRSGCQRHLWLTNRIRICRVPQATAKHHVLCSGSQKAKNSLHTEGVYWKPQLKSIVLYYSSSSNTFISTKYFNQTYLLMILSGQGSSFYIGYISMKYFWV